MNPKRAAEDAPEHGGASGFFRSFLTQGAPPLVRLRHEVADFSADDRIDDPFLEGLLEELGGADDPSLQHARAWLLRSRSLPGRPGDRVVDWRTALAPLVRAPAPPATLLVDTGDHVVLPDARYRRLITHDRDDLALAPACAPLLVGRHDTLRLMGEELVALTNADEDADADGSSDDLGRPSASDIARWEDDFARWSSRVRRRSPGANDAVTTLARRLEERTILASGETPWGTAWPELDRLIGGVWLALRRATSSLEVVELSSGERLVPVGAGVCLALDVRRHLRRDEAHDLRASFRTTIGLTGGFSPPTRHIGATGAPSDATEPGWELPVELHLSGADVAITIRFAFVPWLAEGASVDLMRLATEPGASRDQRRKDELRRRR